MNRIVIILAVLGLLVFIVLPFTQVSASYIVIDGVRYYAGDEIMEKRNDTSKLYYLGTSASGNNRFGLDVMQGGSPLEVQVGASLDDGNEKESDGAMIVTATYVYIQSAVLSSSRYWGGFRFVSDDFPAQGTTIDVAYLRVLPLTASYDDANLNIHFEELASPVAFSDTAHNITDRDKTEASVSWIAYSLGIDWINSPSLCGVDSPIQELFDAYSPTAIVAIARPNQDITKALFPKSWEFAGNVSGVILHLEWEEAGVGDFIPRVKFL